MCGFMIAVLMKNRCKSSENRRALQGFLALRIYKNLQGDSVENQVYPQKRHR